MPTAWGFPRPGRGPRLGGFGILVDSMAVFPSPWKSNDSNMTS